MIKYDAYMNVRYTKLYRFVFCLGDLECNIRYLLDNLATGS